jgi:outer membrane protein assembly factor BamB
LIALSSTAVVAAQAQDWPQWRGPTRDGRATGFNTPKTWPKELAQKWKVAVGEGVSTPALVGDKLFVFARQDGNEILRCHDAATGKELWQDKYESLGSSGPSQGFSGPRSSPAVAEGKVVTIGVRGMISCLDAATGKRLWRKDDFQAYPNFFQSSSPIVVNGLCIAQLGGRENGAIVAYDLATGDPKWKWSGGSPTHASPVLATIGGEKLILAQTESSFVAVRPADGKLVLEVGGAAPGGGGGGRGGRGGGRDYKAATPIVDGDTVILTGGATKVLKIEKQGDGFAAKEVWSNSEKPVVFNTPILKNGFLYGLTPGNELFCVNAQSGQAAWAAPSAKPAADGAPPAGGGGGGGRGRGGMGGGGFGSIVDAGSALLALTPSSELIAFDPSDKAFTELARIKVADSQTHAHPVLSGNRIFIKDRDSVALWTIN